MAHIVIIGASTGGLRYTAERGKNPQSYGYFQFGKFSFRSI
ncbi:hypothetical protein MNBD_GAMMA25-592 [hydrothermal vent metagenome]|uniref:Uncharacterized protein n=1 Tax=hydrothermal vent metagenome TaxID=652676 RepID=A0A3B1AVN8_9ZZZZ